jgi:hypothetical protein
MASSLAARETDRRAVTPSRAQVAMFYEAFLERQTPLFPFSYR